VKQSSPAWTVLLALVAASAITSISSASTIVRQVEFPEPLVESRGGTCRVSVADCPVYADPGEPLLPSLPLCVLLPQGEKITDISVVVSEEREIEIDHPIEWGQAQVPRSMKDLVEAAAADPEIYAGLTPFPQDRAVHVTTQTYRGYNIAYIRVYPVRYVGAQRKLFFAPKITARIRPCVPGRWVC